MRQLHNNLSFLKHLLVRLKIAFIFLLIICCTLKSFAADMTIVPSIYLKNEYDDNVGFRSHSIEDDFLISIMPSLTYDYATERIGLHSKGSIDFQRYASKTYDETENINFEFGGKALLNERFRFNADLSYLKDTTLESELQETGIITTRQNRKRYTGTGGLTYNINEDSSLGMDFKHQETYYDGKSVDYKHDTVTLNYIKQLPDLKNVITVKPYYEKYCSDVNDIDNYGVYLGWNHMFTRTLSMSAFLGGRYTESLYKYDIHMGDVRDFRLPYPYLRPIIIKVEESDHNINGLADISVEKTGEIYSILLGFNYDLGYSANGYPITTTKGYFEYTMRLSERLNVQLKTEVYSNKSDDPNSKEEDSRHLNIMPVLNYRLTENYNLQLGNSYALHKDMNASNNSGYDRNRIWIGLTFNFPDKL